LSVCVSVPRRIPTLLHGPGYNTGNGRGCPPVMHYWVDLQSVHGFRCCDNVARTRSVSECLYPLYAWSFIGVHIRKTPTLLTIDAKTYPQFFFRTRWREIADREPADLGLPACTTAIETGVAVCYCLWHLLYYY